MGTAGDFSLERVERFLVEAGNRRAMKFNTARTRRTALMRLAKHFTPDERLDLRLINRNELAERMRSSEDVTEGTIQTYLTRLEKTIEMYEVFIRQGEQLPVSTMPIREHVNYDYKTTLAIPLRGTILRIANLPHDLTGEEVEQICDVLRAYVKGDEQ